MNYWQTISQQFCQPQLTALTQPTVVEPATLASWYDVSDLACATMSTAWSALHRFAGTDSIGCVNQRLVNLWFGFTVKPIDWNLDGCWDDIAGDYRTADGWIRLHTNAQHHKAAALKTLNVASERAAVQAEVLKWTKQELETAVIANGGCAAAMYSPQQWQQLSQGSALNDEPWLHWNTTPCSKQKDQPYSPSKPLAGVKVLDLTRVIAGPIATRFLAGFGADVLRIDPPGWDELGVIQEVTLGKRCARLDLKNLSDRQQFEKLLAEADILIHGYRADALSELGYPLAKRRELNPTLLDISLNAYGWQGPWRNRRGFDSLVQMSTGIADYGMHKAHSDKPAPLPVQALDHATGYLVAAAAVQALELRRDHQLVSEVRTSLAATAGQLLKSARSQMSPAMAEITNEDYSTDTEQTAWGPAHRIRFPFSGPAIKANWPNGARKLGSSEPVWPE